MTAWKAASAVALVVSAAGLISGVVAIPPAQAAEDAGKAPEATEADDPVVARVNGEEIRRSDALLLRNRLPRELISKPDEEVLPLLIEAAIDTRVLAAEARRQGIHEDPEVQARIEVVNRFLLEQELLTRHTDGKLTDEALQAAYDRLASETGAVEQVRARHILVEDRETAEELIAALDEGGDFESLAKERSTGPSASRGGDLGYFSRDEMVAPFSEVAFGLEVGSYTAEPVQTEFGWHVIKVEDRDTRELPPFNDDMKGYLRQQLANQIRADFVKSLRGQMDIEIPE